MPVLHLALVRHGDGEMDLRALVSALLRLRLDEWWWRQEVGVLLLPSVDLEEVKRVAAAPEPPRGSIVGASGLVRVRLVRSHQSYPRLQCMLNLQRQCN
jgi:hypothetical protein